MNNLVFCGNEGSRLEISKYREGLVILIFILKIICIIFNHFFLILNIKKSLYRYRNIKNEKLNVTYRRYQKVNIQEVYNNPY